MKHRSYRPLAVKLCALACVAAAISLWPFGRDVRTDDDKNRDGQPDVWRVYDRQGELSSMAVDTNFDGRSDVHEYYQRGALVRRESDRDFNDQVDLVQDFDAVMYWSLRNLGVGNIGLIRLAQSNLRQNELRNLEVLDRIRAEVATAYAKTHARFAQIRTGELAIKEALAEFEVQFAGQLERGEIPDEAAIAKRLAELEKLRT